MNLIFILMIIGTSVVFAYKDYLRWYEVYIAKEWFEKREVNAKWHDYSAVNRFLFLLLGIAWLMASIDFYTVDAWAVIVKYDVFIVKGVFLAIFHWFLTDGFMNVFKAKYDKVRGELGWFKLWFYVNAELNGSTARTEKIDYKIKIALLIISAVFLIIYW
ncbi:MAG: hypothetical protein KF721_04820 [Ignavibacteriaceae bacterium]|nr:hypothetical protein [Ignavibacteriaceae bacterium]